jgi:membrane protease YdiL (CAAX protease family)
MAGIIVELAVSWVLLWLIEKRNLSVLGILPNWRRLAQFGILFFVAAICCALGFLFRMYYGERWGLNPTYTFSQFMGGLSYCIKSVLYEELIYRGAILYILIKRLGAGWGIVLSSIAFGIYHWFSFEVLGNVPAMIQLFLVTGLMGLVLAYGFWKTGSMYAAIGIHLGWNLTQSVIFSAGGIGKHLFIQMPSQPVQVSYFVYAIVVYLPMLSAVVISFLVFRRMGAAGISFGLKSDLNSR